MSSATAQRRPTFTSVAAEAARSGLGDARTRPQARTDDRGSALTLGGALVTTALLAGLYYAFAVAVMPGLRHADDSAFVESMQRINESIVNPAFMVAFLGGPALTAVAAWQYLRRRGQGRSARRAGQLILAALVLHLIGLGLTAGANIPLNDALAKAGDPRTAPAAQTASAREAFEGPWTRRHLLRTGVTIAALGCLAGAALIEGRRPQHEPA